MDTLEAQVEIWKTTVQTQQHFNDLQLRLRSFFITLYAAVLTAAAYALKEHATVHLVGITVTLPSVICVCGLIAVAAFYYTDWGYHQLLMGAVKHGKELEAALKSKAILPDDGLTHAISESSRKSKFLGLFKTHSHSRLNWFYGSLFLVMVSAAVSANFVAIGAVDSIKGTKRVARESTGPQSPTEATVTPNAPASSIVTPSPPTARAVCSPSPRPCADPRE